MIITVTPSPSIDRTIVLPDALVRGGVHRVAEVVDQPGGKGVNISRAAVAAGCPTRAVFPGDAALVAELERIGVPCTPVPPAGAVRVNLTITEPDGTTTKLNAAGASVTPADLDALAACVRALPVEGWVVLAGSLPPGAPDGWYADLAADLRADGRRVAIDTSEAALSAVVAGIAPATAPTLLKPNADELASAIGCDVSVLERDPVAVAMAARSLVTRGVDTVLATLGGAGAVLVDTEGVWHAAAPPTRVISTVGAGDSSLFGYVAASLRGASAPDRLAAAVAYGSAAAGLPGTTVPTPDDVRTDAVRVRALDLTATDGGTPWQS